jgi:hypothetical protein
MTKIPEDKLFEYQLTYAWNWFSHHAAQRFAAFNFFLIVVGAVIVAYASATSNHQAIVGVAIAALAAIVALVFLALDFRNRQLVEVARKQLETLEEGTFDFKITTTDRMSRKWWLAHSFCFRVMIVAFLLLALAGGVRAAADIGEHSHSRYRHGRAVVRQDCKRRQNTSPCSASFSSSYGTPTRR